MFRKIMIGFAACLTLAAAALFASPDVRTFAQSNVACYMSQGAAAFHIGSGCTQTVESGGVLNIAAGGSFKIGGYAANATNNVVALDGSNPTSVITGLTAITSCNVTLKATSAPNLSTSLVTVNFSTGQLDIYAWKPTSAASPNLTASTGTENVAWDCKGS